MSCHRSKNTKKIINQSKVRHTNHIDGKRRVKSINFSKTNMITLTCSYSIEA